MWGMNLRYFLAMAAACAVTLLLCVHYLQLRSQVIAQNETIAQMRSTLSTLTETNNDYESHTLASVSLEDIRDTALNKLGLQYASESQIRYYTIDNDGYVSQYREVSGD